MSESQAKCWALVTGGSRGIGAAICETLAAAGHPILLNYRSNDEAAGAVKAKLEGLGVEVRLLRFDVADREASQKAIHEVLEEKLDVGIIVNNAGLARDNSFPQMPWEDWETVTRTTLDGFFNVTQPFVMPMCRRRWGRIINVSSVSGVAGNRGQVNYAAAKAGLIGATKALALEVAKRKVTVNAIAPGLVDTDMVQDAPLDMILKQIPMRRIGKVNEVASLVGWLASEDAAYITGQVITMAGGLG